MKLTAFVLAVLVLLHTAFSQFSYIPGRVFSSCT